MKRRLPAPWRPGLCVLLASGPTLAQFDCSCTSSTTSTDRQVSLYSLPDGSGRPLTRAKAIDSDVAVVATIALILCCDGMVVPFYPAEDIWLESELGGMAHCPRADSRRAAPRGRFNGSGASARSSSRRDPTRR